ncbi:ntf2 [Angomonas deanei]|uniref:NTF2-related export protein n=1 Tax=Angomonas deanei TaxID=59799 RepID=A0A7G2CUK7_9TRYP|nr:ntf2 [Angomonas deanei]CAD2222624.1 Nuclear transport factor 2 (NTF2) domain containing protein, putative [Angomonas deanei]|eukprot:EPY39825.1 ntf2 [Angomonas deanei]
MDYTQVGPSFVQQYYSVFGSARDQLTGIYRPTSKLTWQGEQMQGQEAIAARFQQLAFNEAQFKTDSIECQPADGGILISVVGEVLLKEERYALKYSDVFILSQDEQQQFYVANQIFNLVGGGVDTQGGQA